MRRFIKNNGGFSLVEIILSLALLGIGALLLVGFLGTSVKMLQDVSSITAQNFSSAGQTEKDSAFAPSSSAVLNITFENGTVSVSGYYASNGSYICFVPA